MEKLDLGSEARWILRIAAAAGFGFGGYHLTGPETAPDALLQHIAQPGHPVLVERLQASTDGLQRLENKLDQVLRFQREHERLHHSGG